MLPRLLCEKLCSLNPSVDRLAYSVVWRLNRDGTRVADSPVWYGRTIIRSCSKLDYGTAQAMIDGRITNEDTSLWPEDRLPTDGHLTEDIISDIVLMNSIVQKRRTLRFQSGALSLNRVKLSFELDQIGNPIGMMEYPKGESNNMIEEYMLMAIFLVSEKILETPKALVRNHSPPIFQNIQQLLS